MITLEQIKAVMIGHATTAYEPTRKRSGSLRER